MEARNYPVAYLKEQGQDMVLVLVDDLFWKRKAPEQQATMHELQDAATQAGYRGNVVAVSQRGSGVQYLGPPPWAGFLATLKWETVTRHVNGRIRIE